MKLVLVRWLDAVSDDSGWKPLAKLRQQKPPLVRSVGWIVKQERGYLTLAASLVGDDADGDVTIPVGMIRSVEQLAVKK
ncbi:MAG TPA: hypothetical protein VEC14_07835 [Reyranellaceae bacterium]|nr:hypothetical protein [Reyranellaceae bacterium]